ncbi:MAG: TrkH family potassium uptake protein [Rhizobiales bacterium]|nr:hypothetical protein [Hyphomicrobiales bacterium]NRB14858.1 TrkH family potassium uptake protein [Hyphomicrobiales bacterium]
MNKNGSLYYLGVGILLVGLAELILMLFALLMGDQPTTYAFSGGVILSLFCGSALILATKGKFKALGRLDSILLLVYFWVIIPIFSAIPFYSFMGSYAEAYIETVSALTTTGATVIDNNRYIPEALYLWRSLLAWSGGLLSITMVILILAPFGVGGLQDKSSKFLGSKFNQTENFFPIIKLVGGAYSIITIILVVALMFGGANLFDAFNLILHTISTTGYNLNNGDYASQYTPYTAFIIMLTMFIGAALIVIFFRQFINAKTRLSFNVEVKLFIIITTFFAFAVAAFSYFEKQLSLVDAAAYYFYALFDAVSILSTTGLIINTDPQPINFYYILAFIGGASFTTAGGMKLFRMVILLKYSKIEINQLIFPNSVTSNKFLDMRLDVKFMRLIWSFFIAYMFLVVILATAIASYNYDLNTSLVNAIGAVANIGQFADFVRAKGQAVVPFSELETNLQAILSVGMILGRLEVISVLGLLNFAYWKNR